MKNKNAKASKGLSYKRLSFEKKTAFWGVLFLLPWLFGLIFFFLKPLLMMVWYSLCSGEFVKGVYKGKFVGLDNFKYALTVDADFSRQLITAVTEMLTNVPIQIFVSLFIAILLNGEYKGRGFFRAIFFIPIILATGITTVELAETALNEQVSESVVSAEWLIELVQSSGIPTQLTSLISGYISNIFDVVTTAGVQILIFLSGLQAISPTLYEVAQLEGCSAFETFCKITLPMISPMIVVCLVYSIAESFASATVTETIYDVTYAGQPAFYGYGAAMSMIYFVVAVGCIGIIVGIVSKGVFYYD
ncbi:MAG: sugar ABC transporter permease [Lachnospiraceae bacterium]|nr:sugar ABC transporter permease [Lachnospiraceae bacterium]